MIIDAAAARRADPQRALDWFANQRVFISSAMAETLAERRAVADAVARKGARAVWFEEFGRDADAEEAYLTEVDASTIYIAILKQQYGRLNAPSGFSATEAEYLRARAMGKRLFVLVEANAGERERHLVRMIDRVRFYSTTEQFDDLGDLTRRVERRLDELADEALSPWVKLDDLVFRADEVDDSGTAVSIRGRVGEDVAFHLESMRDQRFARRRARFVHRSRVVEGDVTDVRRRTTAGGSDELTITLERVELAPANAMRFGTGGLSADELVEIGVRAALLGEDVPAPIAQMGSLVMPSMNVDDLRQAFDQPNETAGAISNLVLTEALVGGGHARRITSLAVGPRTGSTRRISLAWEDVGDHPNSPRAIREIEGDWLRP